MKKNQTIAFSVLTDAYQTLLARLRMLYHLIFLIKQRLKTFILFS